MITPEGKVKNAVKKALKERGIYYFMSTQSGYGNVGIPDFVCCYDGKFLAIETKALGKRNGTTANQKLHLGLINEAGGDGIVVDDIQQLEDYFNGDYQKSKAEINQGDWS